MSIRPESLHGDNSGVPINRVMGRVVDRMYLGSSVQYKISGAGDQMWHVTETNPHTMREVGNQIILAADPVDVIILKA